MKILISSLYFFPDHSGIALYSSDLAFSLAKNGYQISVITGFPFYPQWEKKRSDLGRLFSNEKIDGVKIYRGYIYVPSKPTALSRIIQEISFLSSAFINFFRLPEKPAYIIVFTTPVSLALLGVFFKFLYKSKLIINVQDLQIEAASELGILKKIPFVLNILKYIERYTYKHADLVTSISGGMINLIASKGIAKEKIYFFPNWIDVSNSSGRGVPGNFRSKHHIANDKKIIGYAGNIGEKQGLEILADIAKEYESNTSLLFFIIGEGGGLHKVKQYVIENNVQNITFLPFLNQNEYFDFLSDADMVVVSQKKISMDIYFPSKLLGILAKGKPLLAIGDKESELYKVIKEHRIGFAVDYGRMDEVKHSLNSFLYDRNLVDEYRQNALRFVATFDRKKVIDNFMVKTKTI